MKNSEKSSSIVLSILALLFTVGSAVCLWFGLGWTFNDLSGVFAGLGGPLKAMFNFTGMMGVKPNGIPSQLIYNILIWVGVLLWLIFWITHFILLIAKRRPSALFPGIIWFLFGAVSIFLLFLGCAGTYNKDASGNIFIESYLFSGKGSIDCVSFIKNSFTEQDWMSFGLILGYGVLAVVAFLLGFIGVLRSIADVVRHPGQAKGPEIVDSNVLDDNRNTFELNNADFAAANEIEQKEAKDAEDCEMRSYQFAELDNKDNSPDVETKINSVPENKDGKGAVIVQHISYSNPPEQKKEETSTQPVQPPYPPFPPYYGYPPYPYGPYPYGAYPYPPFVAPGQEPVKKEEVKEEKAKEEKPTAEEDRPLTAKELRAVIRDALLDHDHPEELEPLTDEQARTLIREELSHYYSLTTPEKEVEEAPAPVEEETPAPVEEEAPEEELMTSDDLRQLIKETVVSTLSEQPKEEETPEEAIKADDIRQIVAEELDKQPKPEEGLSADDVRQVVAEELTKQPKPEEGMKAEDIRQIVKEELDSRKPVETETKDSEVVLATKEMVEKNAADIQEVSSKQISSDDVRKVVAEELDKYFKNFVPVPKDEVKVEVVPEVTKVEEVPAPKEEATAPETAAPAIVRVPFAERLLTADEDLKDNYNELKAVALSYGLKSRISNSGDTFRLHTKTYLKIAVAGKGLKLYLALDPNDYRNTPIPVKDVGAKNVYKDIPLCFKVKSGLSLKRAKQLIDDVAKKDNLEQKEVTPYDYVAQLRDFHESEDDGIDEED